ncbi:FUSC family protein [Peterkaempfera sp. SMS 1(5)a]|uniref:FUSC family protein n=1 Tax=Peterkaempfera podocarpi TaxID=3232308 RepID=UPI00366ABE58
MRHARPSATARRLPLKGVLRLGPASDLWHKPALSVVVAVGIPELALLAAGRLDLAYYTSLGAMCALYTHGLPYARRARTLALLVLGMLAGAGIALTTSALTDSTAIRVAVAALLAAVHKTACDATRLGPPGPVVLTFMAATGAFLPQRLGDIPGHLTLGLAAGAFAWAVGMAPALLRPHGPERIAVARALESTARLLRTAQSGAPDREVQRGRHEATATATAAWRTLFLVPADRPHLDALERLLVRAESAAAAPGRHGAEAGRLAEWAHDLRRGRALPDPGRAVAGEADELAGIAAERSAVAAAQRPHRATGAQTGRGALRQALHGRSPLLPIGVRVAVGTALAGWLSMAAGVGRPYWAVVTAASLFQANSLLSWRRGLQRVTGSLLGLLLFTALVPLLHTGPAAVVLVALLCQFATEATVARNYWLGNVFLTPMALLMTEFAGLQPAGQLIADRWLDTVLGAAAGLLACALVVNRRLGGQVESALQRVAGALSGAEEVLAAGSPAAAAVSARDQLGAALVDLREAVDTAAGEWWTGALPLQRIADAERQGHQLLAELLRHPRSADRDRIAPLHGGGVH